MQSRLADARSEVKQMKSLVDFYDDKVTQAQEALESQQIINAELLETNERLSTALDAYGYDFSVPTNSPPRYLDVPLDEELQDHIWNLCCAYDIEEHYELVYAVIYRESSFRSNCKSSSSWGLMQINKCNHENLSKKLGITDFLDPYQNVHAGIYMLSNLIHKYDDVTKALMAYNMGEGGASKLWRQGVYTTTYAKRVLATYKQYTEDI
jgi:soluble lytic murein transglycosylase-like protein